MLSKMTNSSNETTTHFQAIQDSCNAILDVDFIIVVDVYALLKNIVKFASKLAQIVKIVKSFEDSF